MTDRKPKAVGQFIARNETEYKRESYPVAEAVTNFFIDWVMAIIKTVFYVMMVLSWVMAAIGLAVSVIGGIIVLISQATLGEGWWIAPLMFVVGTGLCVLFKRVTARFHEMIEELLTRYF